MPPQVHEWPTARALQFIGLTVFVDDASISLAEGGDEPRFIITIDGVDTIFAVALTAGAHTDEILQTSGTVAIAANSRIGVRFDGSGVDASSTLRCEMILDGAQSGSPVPPPPIPTSGLLQDLDSVEYTAIDAGGASTGTWLDDSGNGNDYATGGTLLLHVPVKELLAFNTYPGVTFSRANSFALQKVAPTWYAANTPRTMAQVLRGDNISLGTLFHVRGVAVASHNYQLSGGSLPQTIWVANGGLLTNTTPFFDLNGQKAVVMWWTSGAIGDPLFFSVNGVAGTVSGTMFAEGNSAFNQIGYDEGVFFPDSERAACSFAKILTWNRVLTVSERIGVLSNLTAKYL